MTDDKTASRKQAALDEIGTSIMDALLNEACTMDEVVAVIGKELKDYDELKKRLTPHTVLHFPVEFADGNAPAEGYAAHECAKPSDGGDGNTGFHASGAPKSQDAQAVSKNAEAADEPDETLRKEADERLCVRCGNNPVAGPTAKLCASCLAEARRKGAEASREARKTNKLAKPQEKARNGDMVTEYKETQSEDSETILDASAKARLESFLKMEACDRFTYISNILTAKSPLTTLGIAESMFACKLSWGASFPFTKAISSTMMLYRNAFDVVGHTDQYGKSCKLWALGKSVTTEREHFTDDEMKERIIREVSNGTGGASGIFASIYGFDAPFSSDSDYARIKHMLVELLDDGTLSMKNHRYYVQVGDTSEKMLSYAEVEQKVRHALEGGEESFGSVCSYIWGEVPEEGSLYRGYAEKAYGRLKGKVKAVPEPEHPKTGHNPERSWSPKSDSAKEPPSIKAGDNAMLQEQALDIPEVKRMCGDLSTTTMLITADSARPYKLGMPPERFLELMDDTEFQTRVEIDTGYEFMVSNDNGSITVQITGKVGES